MESPVTGLRCRTTGPSFLKPIDTKRKAIEEYEMVAVETEPLSPTARLFHDPTFNVHVVAIMATKTRISPQPVKEKLELTLLKHPRFTSLLVVDEDNSADMKWVQTKVDLEQHVIVLEVDESQLTESPEKFVEDYIYNLSKTNLDKSKPLWDLHIINVKTRDAESVAFLRVHHSLGDGTSLISLLLACTRQTADDLKLPTIPTKKRRPTPSGYSEKEGSFRLWQYLGKFWLFINMILNTIVDLLMFLATVIFFKDTKTPMAAPPNSASNGRRIVHRIINLDDLKLVKNAMNVTINDVALGITQAGLSKYLNRRYAVGKEDKGATERNNNLPKDIRLRSCLIINLRPSAGIEDLADMMEKGTKQKGGWGNWFGYVLLPFKIALRDDPLDYVKEAKATVDRKKRSFEALITMMLAEVLVKIFGAKVATAVTVRAFSNTTVCFTNLVGPQEEIGFCGNPITYLAPGAYGQPSALMINIQSYINKMIIVVSVDESAIPDPQQLLDDFETSFNLIKDAVVEKGLVKNLK
ncbi:PREDICTED: O-acyltransferase WSD1-like isoform X2 [Nicotiana attenuata]|uniref:O-acyltransferase wsd1 n=1 Tax=Nicotiana attenuata TaxID=49451 RepID=A0A1J6KB67_NICAT|nr:PREDICTED: O-acyltransferase WSD1-like isoform X2 [Nicotiana attenuata]OIT25940.1 o-acyltransferase wsd1 [Nicotiana attenuata]